MRTLRRLLPSAMILVIPSLVGFGFGLVRLSPVSGYTSNVVLWGQQLPGSVHYETYDYYGWSLCMQGGDCPAPACASPAERSAMRQDAVNGEITQVGEVVMLFGPSRPLMGGPPDYGSDAPLDVYVDMGHGCIVDYSRPSSA